MTVSAKSSSSSNTCSSTVGPLNATLSHSQPTVLGTLHFTAEQERIYKRRYEEGYDIPDSDYLSWLAVNHPKEASIASSLITHQSASNSTDPGVSISNASLQSNLSKGSDPLSEILKLPDPKPPKRTRQIGFNNKAVSLTDDEFLEELKIKTEKKKQKETKKAGGKKKNTHKTTVNVVKKTGRKVNCRKTSKIQCRSTVKDRLEALSLTGSDSESTMGSTSHSETESDAQCPKCGLTFQEDDNNSLWICCDGCDSWFDFRCSGLKSPRKMPLKYFCSTCASDT